MPTIVSCSAPFLRRGIISTLRDGGIDAVAPGEAAASGVEVDIVVEVLATASDLRTASANWSDVPVIAVVPEDDEDMLIDAIRSGAQAALPAEAAVDALLVAHRAVEEGFALMPSLSMAAMAQQSTSDDFVSPEEINWLVDLAGGATVARVARAAGYSERSLYRLLHGVYGRLGVGNRYEAVEELRRRGMAE